MLLAPTVNVAILSGLSAQTDVLSPLARFLTHGYTLLANRFRRKQKIQVSLHSEAFKENVPLRWRG